MLNPVALVMILTMTIICQFPGKNREALLCQTNENSHKQKQGSSLPASGPLLLSICTTLSNIADLTNPPETAVYVVKITNQQHCHGQIRGQLLEIFFW